MSKTRVLFVEPNHQFASNITRVLTDKGFAVTVASDLEEALGHVAGREQNVTLVDAVAFGERTLELVDRIKATRAEMEVILLVDESQMGMAMEAMRRGAFDDVRVPFDVEQLCSRLLAAASSWRGRGRRIAATLGDVFAAASFAEAGDHATARKILNEKRRGGPKSGGKARPGGVAKQEGDDHERD